MAYNGGGRPSDSTLNSSKEPSSTRIFRGISLFCSFLVALSAGSNYGFSSYSPQLQERLSLTSTQINIVGVMGNVGVYVSGPFWGRLVDKRGPRLALLVGAILVLIGYGGLSTSYQRSFPQSPSVTLLAIFSLSSGLGNCASFTAAMNAQAKSWSEARRGVCTALVLSGFGLSAFFYSSLSHTLFPGKTADYLLLLALGSAFSFLLGFFIIRIIPPTQEKGTVEGNGFAEQDVETPSGVEEEEQCHARPDSFRRRRTSSDIGARAYAHLPNSAEEDETFCDSEADEERDGINGPSSSREEERQGLLPSAEAALAPKRQRSGSHRRHHHRPHHQHHQHVDITGWKLMKQVDFILIFVIMGLISGTGLLVINNIGTITRTLYEYNLPHRIDAQSDLGSLTHALDALKGIGRTSAGPLLSRAEAKVITNGTLEALHSIADVQQLQAHQVSAISIGNAVGRILIGLLSDLFVSWTGSQKLRVWLLVPVCILALVSQGLAAAPNTINNVDKLMIVSSLTGLMYGTLFGLCPVLTFEWFGLRHFSQNWGIVSLNPVIAGNIFNLLFGSIYDSHVPQGAPAHLCPFGEECFRSVFEITEVAAFVALCLSGVIILRRAGRPGWSIRRR